ncbi:MAG: MBL fold metallo-hydrolase [Candidatus Bilamarchaeaceae archaeon]
MIMEIVFLGTGGGRVNLIKQFRATGGFRINSESANIHVDPGPGALLKSIEYRQDPMKLDAVIITHSHIDHCNDANVLVEAMTGYGFKKRGALIGSRHSIEGDEVRDWAITKYHQGMPAELVVAEPGEGREFKTKKGGYALRFTKAKHDETSAFGFVLKIDGSTVGYTTDTEYFEGLGAQYNGCDYLIINCLKPDDDGIPDHLKTTDCMKVAEIAKPRVLVLSHLGMNMIKAGPEAQAKLVEKKTGVQCIAAKDGMRIGKGLERFL